MAMVPGPDDGADENPRDTTDEPLDDGPDAHDGGHDGVHEGIPYKPDPTPPRLSAWIERNADGPDTYTIAPDEAAGIDLMTRWLTVPADIVLDAAEMR